MNRLITSFCISFGLAVMASLAGVPFIVTIIVAPAVSTALILVTERIMRRRRLMTFDEYVASRRIA